MGISILFLFWNLFRTHRQNKKVGPDPWDGRTLEWTVDSPSPENTFDPMPVVDNIEPLWEAKKQGTPIRTTKEHRRAPIAKDSILPFVLAMMLGLFGICMIYHWFIAAIIAGAGVFVCFIIRALTDERNNYYEKGRYTS